LTVNEKVAALERDVQHNTKQIENFTKNCNLTRKDFKAQVQQLEDKIDNGFKDTIKEAIKESLSGDINITSHQGLRLSDKIWVAIISGAAYIIVTWISTGAHL